MGSKPVSSVSSLCFRSCSESLPQCPLLMGYNLQDVYLFFFIKNSHMQPERNFDTRVAHKTPIMTKATTQTGLALAHGLLISSNRRIYFKSVHSVILCFQPRRKPQSTSNNTNLGSAGLSDLPKQKITAPQKSQEVDHILVKRSSCLKNQRKSKQK